MTIEIFYVGELDAELGVRDDREMYYLLWREVGVVEQLTEYGSSNTSTESVVIGMYTYIGIIMHAGIHVYRFCIYAFH